MHLVKPRLGKPKHPFSIFPATLRVEYAPHTDRAHALKSKANAVKVLWVRLPALGPSLPALGTETRPKRQVFTAYAGSPAADIQGPDKQCTTAASAEMFQLTCRDTSGR